MPPPIAAIFVSSTWFDLQAERKAVADALHRFREAKFIGMEYFGSRDDTTQTASIEEVDHSQLYVGIFAGRYGSGITEAEYRRARQRGLDCLIYFKDERALQLGESEAGQLKKLLALKDELRRNHTVSEFKDANDLAAKVTADIHRWLFDKFLRQAAAEESADEILVPFTGAPLANGHNGFRLRGASDHGAVADTIAMAAPKPRQLPLQPSLRPMPGLVDRESEIAEAVTALTSLLILEFTGAAGTGKTALLRHLAYHPQLAKLPGGVIYCDRVGRQTPGDLLQFCFDAFYDSRQVCHPGNPALLQLLRSQKALVLFDDVELSGHDLTPVFNALTECAIAIATTNRMAMDAKAVYVRGLPVDDAVALIEREYGAPLNDNDRVAAKHLALRLGRSPGHIIQVVAQMRERQIALVDYVAQLPSEEIVAGQLVETRSAPERKLLAALVAAAAPLSKAALAAAADLPQLESILASLEAAQLIESHGSNFTLLANLGEDFAPPAEQIAVKQRLLEHFINAAEQLVDNQPSLIDQAEAIDKILDWAVEQERWPEVLRLTRVIEPLWRMSKHWGAWQRSLERIQQAAENSGDGATADWASHQLGTRGLCLGDQSMARRMLTRVLESRIARGDHWGAAVTRHNLDLLNLTVAPSESTVTRDTNIEEPPQSWWSRLRQLPLAITGSIFAMFCLIIALVVSQFDSKPLPAPALLSFSPNLLEFRSSALHVPALAQSVTITNSGNAPVALGPVSLIGAGHEDYFISDNSCAEQTLAAGGDCRIRVMFTPTVDGPRVAALSLTDQRREPLAQIPVRGQSGLPRDTAPGQITFAPAPFDLGAREVGAGITASLTLTNSGDAPLRVADIIIGGSHRQDFIDAESECRQKEIPQRMSCTIPITFKPSAAGARSATLTVVSAEGAKEELMLRGTGVEAAPSSVSARPPNLSFGAVAIGQRLTRNLLIQNQGKGVEIASIAIEGGTRREFVISQNDCPMGNLADGRSCQLEITFAPAAAGGREAVIVITHSGGAGELRVSLDGSGIPVGGGIALFPEPLEFSEQAVDSQPVSRRVAISNSGSAQVRVGRAEIVGPDARQFAITGNSCGDSLAAQSRCSLTLRYAPKSVGNHRAVLRIEPLGTITREVTLRGAAVVIQKPLAAVTPTRLSFTEVPLGRSRIQEVKINNPGTTELVITRAEIRGAASFALLNQCREPIKPGGPPCTLRIRFTPQTSGSHDAELSIAHNAVDSPLRVPIDGAARERPAITAISVSPISLNFVEQIYGTTSRAQQLAIANTGTVSLNIRAIRIQGANASDFKKVTDNCSQREIASGGRCEITIEFAPKAGQTAHLPSDRHANLVLTYDAAGSRETVALSGVAIPGSAPIR